MVAKVAMFPRRLAFTLVEILVVITVISVLGGVAIMSIQGTQERSRVAKLENDVATVNAALALYEVNGGVIPGGAHPTNIVTLLKQSATAESAAGNQVASGSFVDLRLRAIMMEGGEVDSDRQRAIFDTTNNRFLITNASPGVREFRLDDVENVAAVARTDSLQRGTNGWVWNYADSSTTNTPSSFTNIPLASVRQLLPPNFQPSPGNYPLTSFQPQMQVSIVNQNPSGNLFYSIGGAGRAAYAGPINVPPGGSLVAWVESSDPSAWINSEVSTGQFQNSPHQLDVFIQDAPQSVTFTQAGGEIEGIDPVVPLPVRIGVTLDGIHSSFAEGGNFTIRYTTDGSDPINSSTAEESSEFQPGTTEILFPYNVDTWGSESEITIRAVAVSSSNQLFSNSAEASETMTIARTPMPDIEIQPGSQLIAGPLEVSISTGDGWPSGSQIYYTTNGNLPSLLLGSLYQVPFFMGAGLIQATSLPPAGYEHWFESPPIVAETYSMPMLPAGALVASASIYGSGTFVGNLTYAAPPPGQNMNNISFYSDTVIRGNLYLPGLPDLYVNWKGPSQRWTPQNDALFSPHILGREFNEQGEEIVPATETPFPRVKQFSPPGSTLPNYDLFFYGNSKIEGKVYRQYSLGTLPTVAPPTPKNNNNTVSYSSWDFNPSNPNPAPAVINPNQFANVNLNTNLAHIPLMPGAYGNIAASSESSVILGDPNNPDVVQEYSFQSLSLTGGADLVVVGKVKITVSSTIAIHNGAVMGNAANPDWLQLNFYSTNTPSQWNTPRQFHSTGTSQFFGAIVAPNGEVALDGTSVFQGSVTAYKLQITSNSVLFLLSPIITP